MKHFVAIALFIWIGIILGISFIEAPVKFTAPNMTLPMALGIGKVVFHAMNLVELVICALVAIGLLKARPGRFVGVTFGLAALLLLSQSLYLLPVLDQRVEVILAGGEVRLSRHHLIFVELEPAGVGGFAWEGWNGL